MNSPKTVLTAVVSAAVATSVFAAPSQASPSTQTTSTSAASKSVTSAAATAAAKRKAAAKKAAAKKAAAKKKALAKKKRIIAKRKKVRVRALKALRIAHKKRGARYAWGATGPHAFDCSGLTGWAYKKAGKAIPRTSRAQAAATKRIKSPRKGDLVFFHSGGRVYHVGLYSGKGKVFHAPRTGVPVKTERIWTNKVFYGRVAA